MTMREFQTAARRARRFAFLLLAAVAVACGSVMWSGGWTVLTSIAAVVATGALIGFVPAVFMAIRRRDAALVP